MLNNNYNDPMYAFEIEDEKPAYAILEILFKARTGLEDVRHQNDGAPELSKMAYWRSCLYNARLVIQHVYERELPNIQDEEERQLIINALTELEALLQNRQDFVASYTFIA